MDIMEPYVGQGKAKEHETAFNINDLLLVGELTYGIRSLSPNFSAYRQTFRPQSQAQFTILY